MSGFSSGWCCCCIYFILFYFFFVVLQTQLFLIRKTINTWMNNNKHLILKFKTNQIKSFHFQSDQFHSSHPSSSYIYVLYRISLIWKIIFENFHHLMKCLQSCWFFRCSLFTAHILPALVRHINFVGILGISANVFGYQIFAMSLQFFFITSV